MGSSSPYLSPVPFFLECLCTIICAFAMLAVNDHLWLQFIAGGTTYLRWLPWVWPKGLFRNSSSNTEIHIQEKGTPFVSHSYKFYCLYISYDIVYLSDLGFSTSWFKIKWISQTNSIFVGVGGGCLKRENISFFYWSPFHKTT